MKKLILILIVLFSIADMTSQTHPDILDVPYDKQLHFVGGVIIGGVTHAVVYDWTGSKLAATLASIVVTTMAGAFYEHLNMINPVPGQKIDMNDVAWGTIGAITVSATINIFTKNNKDKQAEIWATNN